MKLKRFTSALICLGKFVQSIYIITVIMFQLILMQTIIINQGQDTNILENQSIINSPGGGKKKKRFFRKDKQYIYIRFFKTEYENINESLNQSLWLYSSITFFFSFFFSVFFFYKKRLCLLY